MFVYWESILLYIEGEKTLSPEINRKATEYLEKYSDTPYKSFVERLSVIKKMYQPNMMTIGFGIGKNYTTGAINKYLKGDITFNFEIGYTVRTWQFTLGYRLQNFNYHDTIRLDHIDQLKIKQSSSIEYNGVSFIISYSLLNKDLFKVRPFISGELNTLVNYISLPDTIGKREKGKTHPSLGFGVEGAIRLTKNLIKNESQDFYYSREEKDFYINPVFLNFRLGFNPNVFNDPTGIRGSIFYITLGVEWSIGKNQATYKYKK